MTDLRPEKHRQIVGLCCSALLLAMLAGGACAGTVSGDVSRNAAFDYWKAAALMKKATRPEEVNVTRFVDGDLGELPPSVFTVWPDVAEWLLQEGPMLSVLASGARKPFCDFGVRPSEAPILNLDHLPMLKQLARRSLATAKAYEYVENTEGAAQIYVDLFRMLEKLRQDDSLASALVGMDILEWMIIDLEGFFSREPPARACRIIVNYLGRRPRPFYAVGSCVKGAGRPFGRWLLADPQNVEARLAVLYGSAPKRPAIDRLVTLSPKEKEKRLRKWVMDYEAWLIRIGDAIDKPYRQGIKIIRDLDEEKQDIASGNVPPGSNPLIPLLVPSMANYYESYLLAEGQLDMITILAWAALHRAEKGRWPVNYDEMRKKTRGRVPRDPYTGEFFYYKLIKVRPRIVTHVPKWIAKKKLFYKIDVTRRRKMDEIRFGQAVKRATEPPARTVGSGIEASVPLR